MVLTLVGGIAGAGVKAVEAGVGGVSKILVGKIDPAQVVKYSIFAMILIGILIIIVSFFESIETFFGGAGGFWYQTHWYLLCLFYLVFALITIVAGYIWLNFVLGLLLNIDAHLNRFDDWIYGRKKWMSDESFN